MDKNNKAYSKAQRITLNTMTIDESPKRKAGSGVPRWAVIAFCMAAISLAAVLLCAFVFFAGPQQQAAGPVPTETAEVTPPPTPTPTPTPVPTPTPTLQPTPTPVPTPSTMWGAGFPDKFTDGEVIKNDSSVLPTIIAMSPRFQDCEAEVAGTYKSENVNVTVNRVKEDGVVYFVADIYITDLKYFTAPFSDGKYSKGGRKFTYKIAREHDAIVAINGDFYTYNDGPVLRDGKLYRNEVKLDILVMYKDGTMKTLSKSEYNKEMLKSMEDDVWQIWTFGPMLLKDGEPMTDFNLPKSIGRRNPRSAVGYYEPGHYVFVNVDGRLSGYSKGLSMKDLSKLMYDLGCKVAFNLDGGGSAQIAFMGEEINRPCGTYRKNRDALCIIDEPASGEDAS